jgi:hypothetical protein
MRCAVTATEKPKVREVGTKKEKRQIGKDDKI